MKSDLLVETLCLDRSVTTKVVVGDDICNDGVRCSQIDCHHFLELFTGDRYCHPSGDGIIFPFGEFDREDGIAMRIRIEVQLAEICSGDFLPNLVYGIGAKYIVNSIQGFIVHDLFFLGDVGVVHADTDLRCRGVGPIFIPSGVIGWSFTLFGVAPGAEKSSDQICVMVMVDDWSVQLVPTERTVPFLKSHQSSQHRVAD